MTTTDTAGLLLGMFVVIMFSARISGSHFNPCITFSYMIGNVKHRHFDFILGCLYIAAQFIGAQLGVIFSSIFAAGLPAKITLNVDSDDIIQQIVLEMMGSFFLVFMYLCSTDVKTKFTKDAAIQTVILAGSYLGAMLLAGVKLIYIRASPVNPAISFAIILWNPTGINDTSNWKNVYIFCLVSFAGSLLALIFFRYVYQKTTETMDEIDDEEDERNEDEL